MAMTETVVPVCTNTEMKLNPKIKPHVKPGLNPVSDLDQTPPGPVMERLPHSAKLKKLTPIFKPKNDVMLHKPELERAPKPISTQTFKKKPIPTFKQKNTSLNLKVSSKPTKIESDSESDSDVESEDEGDLYYERWINGEQLLVSTDNKRIYDPETYEHIGNMLDESIDWCI